jgi:poly-gamma-glutamate capsule biosynthesis protein CapA/YwtB (metallophosphatase superfamily)
LTRVTETHGWHDGAPAGYPYRVILFLAGDVMTGRGVDQILPNPGDPTLWEDYVHDAGTYVELAEAAGGPIPRPVDPSWLWGDALSVLDRISPAARILNLETSITDGGEVAAGKGIHYRMHPANIDCLAVARPSMCTLANNHVLDFGRQGLADTITALSDAGIRSGGAGRDATHARGPVIIPLGADRRIVVFAAGTRSSGIPPDWAATRGVAGVHLLPDLSMPTAADLAADIRRVKHPGDIVIFTVHWGSNWGYRIPTEQMRFAHHLVEHGVDVVHGHSSHHPRPIEIHHGRLILYGCGDFIDDYEGIGGYGAYRSDLRLMYLPSVDPYTGHLARLTVVPLQARRMRLHRASTSDTVWLRDLLDRLSRPYHTRIQLTDEDTLEAGPLEGGP